jgi:hypothetical protein
MATKEYTQFIKRGGIYYTDYIQFDAAGDDLTAGAIQFTTTPALIDTRIDQVSARHVRPVIVRVKTKT